MTLLTDAALLARIERFLEATGMKPTRFGRDALGEASLIDSLRKGRSLSLKTANRVIAFMDGYVLDHSGTDTPAPADDAAGKGNEASAQAEAA